MDRTLFTDAFSAHCFFLFFYMGTSGLIDLQPKFAIPKIWQAKCERLASFGSQPNNSQNYGSLNLWFGKF
jgi:hypothetical protein